jgi:hypothetical protein
MSPYPCLVAIVLALSIPVSAVAREKPDGRPIRLAQAADTTSTSPSVTPVTPNSTSATCMSGCSTQSLNCQNNCMSTANGTTVIPSVTTAGVTTNPTQCATNCSSQLQQCQRGCALEQ